MMYIFTSLMIRNVQKIVTYRMMVVFYYHGFVYSCISVYVLEKISVVVNNEIVSICVCV